MSSRRISTVKTTCLTEGEIHEIQVEVMIRNGLQRFDIIGLPQHMIREGRDRILSSLAHLGIELPAQKILVSLTPGGLPKDGTHFDLPILYAILKSLGIVPNTDDQAYLWGELSLRGEITGFPDILAHWLYASTSAGSLLSAFHKDASKIQSYLPCPLRTFRDVKEVLEPATLPTPKIPSSPIEAINTQIWTLWLKDSATEWDQLQGSEDQFLFWCLVILGRHSVLLEGPPGVGKSSWIKALHKMQLPLLRQDWLYLSCPNSENLGRRPFVMPHHSSSKAAIVGGGSGSASAGALTKAHQGILFLDEFAEFTRDVIESLREPLELKQITISRASSERVFQADTQVLAAMNLCRCGRTGSEDGCSCSALQFHVYKTKVSGPIRERFDLNLVWSYHSQKKSPKYDARNVKERIICALSPQEIDLSKIEATKNLSPRRQKSWQRVFISWCRWNQVPCPESSDVKNFNEFLTRLEKENHHDEIRKRY